MKRKNSLKVFFGIVLFSSFFLTGFVGASDSFSEVEFSLSGCIFQFDESLIGVAAGECSVGENSFGDYSGLFFCDADEVGYLTNETGIGCSRGSSTYTSGTALGACCPADKPICSETNPGEFQCTRRIATCNINLTESACEAPDVDGYYLNDDCICTTSEQSCDIYKDSTSCNNDDMNIGSVGVGRSEFCGSSISCGGVRYSIPIEDCGCSWDGNSCEHSISAEEMFSGEDRSFQCSSSYEIDPNCIDGFRNVTWSSVQSQTGNVAAECFDILECNGGSELSQCGVGAVKLPGFSLFALFLSLFAIGIYYFVSGKFKYKKRFVL